MALDGKSSRSMPSLIRRDMEMRNYFQMGWVQAEEDLALQRESSGKTDWRGRFAWGIMMIVGGISTMLLMTHNIKKEQAEQARLIAGLPAQTQAVAESKIAPQVLPPTPQPKTTATSASNVIPGLPIIQTSQTTPTSMPVDTNIAMPSDTGSDTSASPALIKNRLSLLSNAQRDDLSLTQKAQQNANETTALALIHQSNIKISHARITSEMHGLRPGEDLGRAIPKYVRELYFYTHVKDADKQTLTHRWLFNHQVLAAIPLLIKSDDDTVWSSKVMSSAWQGTWHLEVLDAEQNVLFRQTFIYGAP